MSLHGQPLRRVDELMDQWEIHTLVGAQQECYNGGVNTELKTFRACLRKMDATFYKSADCDSQCESPGLSQTPTGFRSTK